MKITYEDWSANFKRLKNFKCPAQNEIDLVIYAYKKNPPPAESLRKGWKHPLGFRKNVADGKDRGEQEIERLLLGPKGDIKNIQVVKPNGAGEFIELKVSDHNFPFSKLRKGQVISDAFGYHVSGKDYRPVAIEVKVSNGSPWLAVVENLVQVRLARYNLKHIEDHGRKLELGTSTPRRVRGAWGLVVAPSEYYDEPTLAITRKLIDQLKEQTEARIMLATFDKKNAGALEWFAGYWP